MNAEHSVILVTIHGKELYLLEMERIRFKDGDERLLCCLPSQGSFLSYRSFFNWHKAWLIIIVQNIEIVDLLKAYNVLFIILSRNDLCLSLFCISGIQKGQERLVEIKHNIDIHPVLDGNYASVKIDFDAARI